MLSVVIAWQDRPELAQSLSHNLAVLDEHAEIVIAASGDIGSLHAIVAAAGGTRRRVRVLVVDDDPGAAFVKSRSCNLGVFAARAPDVLLLDADVLLDAGTVESMRAAQDAHTVVCVARVRESASPGTAVTAPSTAAVGPVGLASFGRAVEVVGADGRVARAVTNRVHFDDGSRAGPGLVLFARSQFLAVGGMDAHLVGWGWEDVDLLLRLQLVLGVAVVERGSVVHLSHGDDRRVTGGAPTPEASEARNFDVAMARYLAGDLLGTGEADVAARRASGS